MLPKLPVGTSTLMASPKASKSSLPELTYMPFSEVEKYFSPIYTPGNTPHSGMFRGRNVVFIIWESLAREWVGGSIGRVVCITVDTCPTTRSEERRVGKECRSRWSPYH